MSKTFVHSRRFSHHNPVELTSIRSVWVKLNMCIILLFLATIIILLNLDILASVTVSLFSHLFYVTRFFCVSDRDTNKHILQYMYSTINWILHFVFLFSSSTFLSTSVFSHFLTSILRDYCFFVFFIVQLLHKVVIVVIVCSKASVIHKTHSLYNGIWLRHILYDYML